MSQLVKIAETTDVVSETGKVVQAVRHSIAPQNSHADRSRGLRFTRVIWLPVALKLTSSMNVRIRRSPRPPTRPRLAGSVGSGKVDGSKPGPSSRIVKTASERESLQVKWTCRFRYGACCRRSSASR